MITTRRACREALAALLQTALVGAGKPAQAVYDYQIGDFAGASPVVVVSSAGSSYDDLSFQGLSPSYDLNIHVFVVYAATGWTEDDAENALDAISETIAAVLAANKVAANWDGIAWVGSSKTLSVDIGGVDYRTEIISIKVE